MGSKHDDFPCISSNGFSPLRKSTIAEAGLRLALSMGSKSNDFLMVFKQASGTLLMHNFLIRRAFGPGRVRKNIFHETVPFQLVFDTFAPNKAT